jgi:hypothetical protein
MPDRLLTLQQRRARLELQIARESTRVRTTANKRDTRRKILIGAVVISHGRENPAWWHEIEALLDRDLHRPFDRALFGLPPRDRDDESA